ncbi:MAG: valine--tRNA ligase [Gammaproteobacteria bacterium]|nr:valine--tRNA ligase [Gammaproteobacteria bacterium]
MKNYSPQDIEGQRYAQWESAGYFAPQGNGTPFSIAIPPPNVTGTLHMGHAFQHSLVDALIRYRRMQGRNTLWQMGTDHAGIATQMIVTEQLAAQGIKPSDIGRDAFIDKAWEWKETSGGTITRQLRRLGASLHWDTERFTLDEGLSRAVLEVFVRLHDEGLIYKGKRLVNWDPVLKTSLSDLEVESEDEKGHLWHFHYPLVAPMGDLTRLTVATTRPETMLGDVAVAVNPDDARYKDLVGAEVELPLTGRRIPVIADHYVDQEFGTGCVKITPAHDFNDYDIGRRHDLPMINVLNDDATMNDDVPEPYRGLDRFDARTRVVQDLDALGLLDKVEDHTHPLPRGEKSGVVVEPYLSDQWFVKIQPLAEPAIKAVEDGDIEFIPKNYENTYFAWMREMQDWTISRQQWWGHRIPAWYDDAGNVYVARSEAKARAKHDLADDLTLVQEDDVLDTWFSSALWTFSTLGWPDDTPELRTYHSTDVMVTGHDIITFWVSRMIMMTLKFMGEVPFRKVYVTGMVTDADGNKMSKSRGNGLDPLDIIDGIDADGLVEKRTGNLMQPRMAARIEKNTRKEFPDGIEGFGTDALRFTFYALANRSRTLRFDMNRIQGYRNFCNKLWNATRYVLTNTEGEDCGTERGEMEFSIADRWIRAELDNAVQAITLAMETFRFDLASKALYEFVWDEYCDWYVEAAKTVLTNDTASDAAKRGTRNTLVTVLEETLRLAHPYLPFMTEELWLQVAPLAGLGGETIMLQTFPTSDESRQDDEAVAAMAWTKEVVTATRNIRGQMDISFAKQIPVLFNGGTETDRQRLEESRGLLEFLVKPESLTWLEPGSDVPVSATHVVGQMQVCVPLEGLIDKDQELARLDKEIGRLEKEKARVSGKVSNPNFVEKAPAEVVGKERARLTDINGKLEQLGAERKRVAAM